MSKLKEAFEEYFGEGMEASSPWVYRQDEGQMPRKDLLDRMELVSVKKGTVLFMQHERSERVYVVKEGVVRTSMSRATGDETHLLIAGPGSLIGAQICVDGYPNCVTAIAIEDCQLYAASVKRFTQWIEEDVELKNLMLLDFSRKIRVLAAQFESLVFDTADVRMMRSIIFLIEKFGVPIEKEKKVKIDMTFTHQEMADLIHSNRVTVSKFFSKLLKENIIEKKGKYYYIKDSSYFHRAFE